MDDLERLYRLSPPSREAALWLHGPRLSTRDCPRGPALRRAFVWGGRVGTDGQACAQEGRRTRSLGGAQSRKGLVSGGRDVCVISTRSVASLSWQGSPHPGALQPRRPRCAGEPEGRAAALVARGPSVVWVYGYPMGRLTVSCLSPGSGGVLDVPQGASAACYSSGIEGERRAARGAGAALARLAQIRTQAARRLVQENEKIGRGRARNGSPVRLVRARQGRPLGATGSCPSAWLVAISSEARTTRAARCASGGLCPGGVVVGVSTGA